MVVVETLTISYLRGKKIDRFVSFFSLHVYYIVVRHKKKIVDEMQTRSTSIELILLVCVGTIAKREEEKK
jgi:hypothetical protein